jgi:hypothetical protein
MNEKQILFGTPMVKTILRADNPKTQTRRVITPQPILSSDGMWRWKDCQWMDGGIGFPVSGIKDHTKYQIGDILWVREAFTLTNYGNPVYKADYRDKYGEYWSSVSSDPTGVKWKPSIHMPRVAARIFLKVTDVRVEQIQDISEADAKAEGIRSYWLTKEAGAGASDWHESNGPPFVGVTEGAGGALCSTRRAAFSRLWDSINSSRGYGWDTNPWVWAYTFERCAKPVGWPTAA